MRPVAVCSSLLPNLTKHVSLRTLTLFNVTTYLVLTQLNFIDTMVFDQYNNNNNRIAYLSPRPSIYARPITCAASTSDSSQHLLSSDFHPRRRLEACVTAPRILPHTDRSDPLCAYTTRKNRWSGAFGPLRNRRSRARERQVRRIRGSL